MSKFTSLVFLVSVLGLTRNASGVDDTVVAKLEAGLTRAAIVALVGSDPDAERCTTTLGLRSCVLVWIWHFPPRRIEVRTVFNRLVVVTTCRSEKPCDRHEQ